jgi:ribosomal protein L11 methyltransferase
MMQSGHVGLSFEASGHHSDLLEGFFLTHSTLAGIEEKSDGSLLYYIPASEWMKDFQESLQTFCLEHSEIEFLGSTKIQDHDWNAEWEATILPQRATTELVITPSWKLEEARAMSSKYTIQIDPKMSFGTGHHETTRLCLHAIEEIELSGMNVLDLGTGSGVLAMYALMRGAKHAVGIDTDSWSITNAVENRTLNNISESQFEIRQGTLETAAREGETFDVILANLHRNILIENARLLREHATPNAWLVLSGILVYDVAEIRTAFEDKHLFTFAKELRENEWICLIFQASK